MNHPELPNYFNDLPVDVEEKLQSLIRVAFILGVEDLSSSSYTSAICHMSAEDLRIKTSLNRMKYVEEEMLYHLACTKHEEYLATKWINTFEDTFEAGNDTSILERQKAALKSKARDYQKELEKVKAQMPSTPAVTVSEVMDQRERIRSKEQELKAKRAKIQAFKGLPPNLELARHELRNARQEQMQLIQLRERLLGAMAAGVS